MNFELERSEGQVSPIGVIFGFGTIMGFLVGTVIVYQILYSANSTMTKPVISIFYLNHSESTTNDNAEIAKVLE